jgi:hypothetical protein
MMATTGNNKTQSDKFKEAAKEHQADLDEARWEERLKKVAKQRQPDDTPE